MSASNHKVGSPIRVWQNLGNTFINQASNLKQWWDQVGEIVRLKHDALCDYIDSDIATKSEVQSITLGEIIDGTITTAKLDPDALQANVTKLTTATGNLYGATNVDDALKKVNDTINFYHITDMSVSGGSNFTNVSSGFSSFTTEEIDIHNMFNPASPDRFVIPSGKSKARISIEAYVGSNAYATVSGTFKLYKNGVQLHSFTISTTENMGYTEFYEYPMYEVIPGDYFQVNVTSVANGSARCLRLKASVI